LILSIIVDKISLIAQLLQQDFPIVCSKYLANRKKKMKEICFSYTPNPFVNFELSILQESYPHHPLIY
tara:strand:+ start:103 stop:306 length:204 start_codon:yes stop_codon:yes gene_type:complete